MVRIVVLAVMTGLVSAALAASPPFAGKWRIEAIKGADAFDTSKTMFEVASDGQVSSTIGCNRMVGKATPEAEHLRLARWRRRGWLACRRSTSWKPSRWRRWTPCVRGGSKEPRCRCLTKTATPRSPSNARNELHGSDAAQQGLKDRIGGLRWQLVRPSRE